MHPIVVIDSTEGRSTPYADFTENPSDAPAAYAQVREFLGDRCTPQLREHRWAVTKGAGGTGVVRERERAVGGPCAVDTAGWDAVSLMLNQTDVVGTTDQFDAFWLTLSGELLTQMAPQWCPHVLPCAQASVINGGYP
jgi:hypothetical protein